MKLNLYLLICSLKRRLKNILKSFIYRPDFIDISINNILQFIGPKKLKTFVQIGSNDGVKNDPLKLFISAYKLKGIMIEPFANNYNKLVANYSKEKNIIFEKVGISDYRGEFDFYYIKDIETEEPDWYDQVGSFDKETFLKNIEVVPDLLNRIGIEKIPCFTISQILEKNNFLGIDLIHIDAEGYDFRILKSIDFKQYQPQVIIFETDWITLNEMKEAKKLLGNQGYSIYISGIDCIAIKK